MIKPLLTWICIAGYAVLTSCGGGHSSADCQTGGYFVASSGDDSNPGNSSCAPWKTLGKLAASSFPAGTTIYLHSGDSWHESLQLPASGISITSYGSGPMPLLDGAVDAAPWSSQGSQIYRYDASLAAGEALGNISRNGSMMLFQPWAGDAMSSLAAAPLDSYSYDNNSNIIYIKVAGEPSNDRFRISTLYRGIMAENLSAISIQNVNITRFSLHGIELKNCTGCNVSNVTVSATGGARLGNLYAGNGIEYGNASSDGVVDQVSISDIFDSCLSPQTYASAQTISNLRLQNSSLSRCGFAGVELSVLSNGGSSGSSISNVQLDHLQITDMGRGWSGQRYGSEAYGIRIQADSGAGSIDNTSIHGCDINGQVNTGIRVLGDTGVTRVSASRIRSNGNSGIGFATPAGISSARLLLDSSLIYNNTNDGVNFNCPDCQGLVIYHNTFYDNGSINLGIFNQANQALIKNNIFYGSTPMTQLYVNAALAGAEVDFNCYTEATNMFGYNGMAYDTVAAFNTATGFESAGSGNAAGGLLDPANGQFGLTTASACRYLGSPGTGISSDFAGLPYASPPSAGALQYQP